MKILLFASAFACCWSIAALADPICDMGDAKPVDVFEPAKAAFLEGNYVAFATLTTPLSPRGSAAFGDAIGSLREAFPNGFVSCQTVVQRVDMGGMVQEITTFNIRGIQAPMAIYLMALPTRGALEISFVTFDTTMSAVLDQLR